MAFFMIIDTDSIAAYALLISIPVFFFSLIRLSVAAHRISLAKDKDHSCIDLLSKAKRISGTALPVWHASEHDVIEIYVNESEKCTFRLNPEDLHPVPGDTVVLYRLPEPLQNTFYITDETRTYMTETSYRFACEAEQRNGCCPAETRKRNRDALWLFGALALGSVTVFLCSCSALIDQIRGIP